MLGAQGVLACKEGSLYRTTPVVTWGLGSLVSSEGPPHSVASYNTQGDAENLFYGNNMFRSTKIMVIGIGGTNTEKQKIYYWRTEL
jgi:hypothetical protein